MSKEKNKPNIETSKEDAKLANENKEPKAQKEVNGRKGPDPTRYGDWEKNGRCIDF